MTLGSEAAALDALSPEEMLATFQALAAGTTEPRIRLFPRGRRNGVGENSNTSPY